MNSTAHLGDKASSDAMAYAMKKRQQMERAAQLREERKAGAGNLKNAASDMFSVQKDSRSQQYTPITSDQANSIMSSPTVPSTYNGGSNFNATGNARDHGISRQSPNSFMPGLTGMSQAVGYREIPGYVPQYRGQNYQEGLTPQSYEGGYM
jgi:hypothetical protein